MILYSPLNSEVLTEPFLLKPKSCFIMSPLGDNASPVIIKIRGTLDKKLQDVGINSIDATKRVTGGDFLDKIWKQILSVPFGVAIIDEKISQTTLGNIFYELGLFDILGKYSVVIKTKECEMPSDFKRSEYLSFDDSFENNFNKFLDTIFEQEDHYVLMAETFAESKPILAIDYLRRAFLISGDQQCQKMASKIFEANKCNIDEHHRIFIDRFIKT